MTHPSLCQGRRVYGQDYLYDCSWLHCPILDGDELCSFRASDDDPNPDDEPSPRQDSNAAP